jgi:hypothetical protein
MTGQAAVRMLLVIILIGTAHAIKPFSVTNFTNHLLHSSRSFDVILPDSDRTGLNYATLLALTLSNTFFSGARNDRIPTREPALDQGALVAVQTQPAAKAHTLKVKRLANRAAKRTIRIEESPTENLISRVTQTEEPDDGEEIASTESASEEEITEALPPAQVMKASLPVVLPDVLIDLSKVRLVNFVRLQFIPHQIDLLYRPNRSGCETLDSKKVRIIAVIELKKRISGSREDLECDREGSRTTAGEDEAPGPQIEVTKALDIEAIPSAVPQPENCTLEQE